MVPPLNLYIEYGGTEVDVVKNLSAPQLARAQACMAAIQGRLGVGSDFDLNLSNLIVEDLTAPGTKAEISSDDADIQELRQILSTALKIKTHVWKAYPDLY